MLIATGDKWDRLTSWAALTTSSDGFIWTQDPVNPFGARVSANGVAASPEMTVVVGSGGYVASSPDLTTWHSEKIWQGNFEPLAIKYATDGTNGLFITVGQGKILHADGPYHDMAEAAQIFKNATGQNDQWELIYSYSDSQDSRFYGVKFIAGTWIAVGSASNKPMAVYSNDFGVTWNNIAFPSIAGVKYAYDVIYNDNRFWFTVNGMVWVTTSLSNPVWDASSFIKPTYGIADMKQIAFDPISKYMVAASSGGLVYSLDLNSWSIFEYPGYRFKSITFFNGLWIAGADSNLSMYTYWTSKDAVTWTPGNNQVRIYDFAQI